MHLNSSTTNHTRIRTAIRNLVTGGVALLVALQFATLELTAQEITDAPQVILSGIPFSVSVSGTEMDSGNSVWFEVRASDGRVLGAGTVAPGATGSADGMRVNSGSDLPLTMVIGDEAQELQATFLPGWFALVPPLVAILLALIFKEVISALFAGIWLGALAIAGFNPLSATARVIDQFALPAITDPDHTAIILFSMLLGGMVGIIAKNGGTLGIVEAVSPYASTPVRGKIATWAAGLAIFFDDYANTLIVGNTMRPITDRLKISREKLAYIVDSTAAPVAAMVPLSTWVGYVITLTGDGMAAAAGQAGNSAAAAALASASPLNVFVQTIPYLFYPILALAFVFLTSWMNRDFGAMATAEQRAASGGGLIRPGSMPAADTEGELAEPKEGAPHRWWNAALPVLTVMVVVLAGLYTTGRASVGPGASLGEIFGDADPFSTLLWGSLAGCLMAVFLSLSQKILTVHECIGAWFAGLRAMVIAMVILTLAWSLGSMTGVLGTADYLAQALSGTLPLQLLPALVFILGAGIAFATGTSWGTMSILLPVVIPLAVALGGGVNFDMDASYPLLLGSIGSVLAGAIFGDHCSPISDTTVMSSMASGCDHVDHVRTQLPYALLVGAVGIVVGNIGTAYGLPPWIALIIGFGVLFLILRSRGQISTRGEVSVEREAETLSA